MLGPAVLCMLVHVVTEHDAAQVICQTGGALDIFFLLQQEGEPAPLCQVAWSCALIKEHPGQTNAAALHSNPAKQKTFAEETR